MSRAGILIASLTVIMIASTIAPAFAAQMEFRTWVQSDSVDEVEIKFQRTIIINYDDGGMIADELRGQKFAKTFTVTSSDPGINELRDRINYQLSQAGSSAAVTDVRTAAAIDVGVSGNCDTAWVRNSQRCGLSSRKPGGHLDRPLLPQVWPLLTEELSLDFAKAVAPVPWREYAAAVILGWSPMLLSLRRTSMSNLILILMLLYRS